MHGFFRQGFGGPLSALNREQGSEGGLSGYREFHMMIVCSLPTRFVFRAKAACPLSKERRWLNLRARSPDGKLLTNIIFASCSSFLTLRRLLISSTALGRSPRSRP